MGTGCSVTREVHSNIPSSIHSEWTDNEPINQHKIDISDTRETSDIKLTILTNDTVLWTFGPGPYTKWRIVEVFKKGTEYFPIEGGENIVLDRENVEIETTLHFPMKLIFAVIPNAIEFSPEISIAFFVKIMVAPRNPIKCSITESGYEFPSMIGHIGLPVVFSWKHLKFPISVVQGEVDLEFNIFRITTRFDTEFGRSGQIIFTPSKPGVTCFAVWKGENEIIDICSVRSYLSTLSHRIEVRKGHISPLVSEIRCRTPVLFNLRDTNIVFSDENCDDSNEKMLQPYFYRIFIDPGIHNFVTADESSSVSGLIIVIPTSTRHKIRYTQANFDSIVLKCKTGDTLCFTNITRNTTKFAVKSTQNTRPNIREHLHIDNSLINKHFQGDYVEFSVVNSGAHLFKTEENNYLVAIASNGPKTHNIMVNNRGFVQNLNNISQEDGVLWYWGGETSLHNIVQVTFNGDSIEEHLNPFYSGPPSGNTGFHRQFDDVGNFYYISEGHTQAIRGEIIVWPTSRVHIIPCAMQLALQPNYIEVSVNDWIVWLSQPDILIDVQFGAVIAADIDSYLTQLNPNCCAFNVPLSGLISLNFKITFAGLEDGPSVVVQFFVVSDEILSPNTIHFPLFQTQTDKVVNNGNCLLINSNKERQIEILLNSINVVKTQPILIPLEPYEHILITFWKQGLYKLTHSDSVVNINVSKGVKTCPTPQIKSADWNEICVGDSLDLERENGTVIYTLDGSYPNLGSPGTQILSGTKLTFPKEGMYVFRAVGMDNGCLDSKVLTHGPIIVSNPGQFSYQPTFSYEVISHMSLLLSWSYARSGFEHIFKHSLLHNGSPVALESVNTSILTDLTPETEQEIKLEISEFGTNKFVASTNYSFNFPLYTDTVALNIIIEKERNLARISWDRHTHTVPVVREYAVYVDRQLNCRFPAVLTLGSNDTGDEKRCVILLEDLEEGELYIIQVTTIAITFEGIAHTFKSQEIPFNNLDSKSFTSEEPKLTSTDAESRSFSVESDVPDRNVRENLVQTNLNTEKIIPGPSCTVERTNILNKSELKPVETIILKEKAVEDHTSRVELGVKEMSLDFIEVTWSLVEDTQQVVNTNLDSLVIKLNGDKLHSTAESAGSLKLEHFPLGVINRLSVEAYFYEYSINPTRHSSEIFFTKFEGRHPDSLILIETDTQLRNAIEFKFETPLSVCLKSLKFDYTPETQIFSEILRTTFSKVDFIRYTVMETNSNRENTTFSDTWKMMENDATNIESSESPYISVDTNQRRLTIHNCKPGHTYELSTTLIYSKSEIRTSKNSLYILPFESEATKIGITSIAPPSLPQPTLSRITRSGIEIAWANPSIVKTPIIGYAVYINGDPIEEILDATLHTFHYIPPIPGSTYIFTIKALTNHPCGNSNGITLNGIQPLSAYDNCILSPSLEVEFKLILPLPRIIDFTPCVGTSVRVVWEVEDRDEIFLSPDCFMLSWQPVGTPLECRIEKHILYKKTPKFSYKLLGLAPWTEYELEICLYAKDPNKKGSFIETNSGSHKFMSIGPPISPCNLRTESIWFDKIRTIWDPIDEKFIKMIPSHIWAFVYYKNKVFVRFNKIDNANSYFELESLKPDTVYTMEFYGVLDSLNSQFDESTDPIEGYEMRNKILLSLHSCVKFDIKTLSIDFDVFLNVVSEGENTLAVSWGEPIFPEGVKMYSYTLECGTDDTLDDIQCEDISKQKQIATLKPEDDFQTFKNLISGLLYKIQLKSNLLEVNGNSKSVPYTVLLRDKKFRLPAPPEKPIFFLSEITQTTLLLTWNKSRSHFPTDSNIKTVFKGYHLFVNEISHRLLPRNTTKYSICIKQLEILRIQLIALGQTVCRTKNEKNLIFDETNESEIMGINLETFWEHFNSFSIHFLKLEDLQSSDSVEGYVAVSWQLKQVLVPDIVTIKLVWWYESDEIQNENLLPATQTEFQIENPIPKELCCVRIYLNFPENSIDSLVFKCQIPSPPEIPVILMSNSRADKGVTLKWHEPLQYGDVLVTGYQMYNDDVIIGPILDPSNLEVFLPLKLSENYNLKLETLTAHPNISKLFSNTIQTKQKISKTDVIKHKFIEIFVKEVKSQSIEVGWRYFHPKGKSPNHYRVEWSSILNPVSRTAILPNTLSSHTIRECFPGKTYFIHAKAIGKFDKILLNSAQLKVQTSASPDSLHLTIQSVSSNIIMLSWKRPVEYGNAKISHYTIFIDNESVDIDGGANSFVCNTLPCETYIFRMLANTNSPVGPSRLSNVLSISTPGLKIPVPKQFSSGKLDSIAFSWDSVTEIGGAKLSKIDVFCAPKQNEDILSRTIDMCLTLPGCKCHVDLTRDTLSDTFHSLDSQSDYFVFLKATDNENTEYFSEIVEMAIARKPVPPNVVFTNLSLDKQNDIRDELIEFINDRDSLQLKLCWQQTKTTDIRTTKGQKIVQEIAELSGALFSIEKSILNRLKYLKSQSSLISVHLKLNVVNDTPEVSVCGYEVLVNGCRECVLSLKQTNCTVEVNKAKFPKSVSISVRALTEHPIGQGDESEELNFEWDSDFPSFSYFCLRNCHSKDGGCLYLPTFESERSIKQISSLKHLINRGHFESQTHPTKTKIWNIFQNQFVTFPLRWHSGSLDFVLFWTLWCEPSQKALDFFVKFSEKYSTFMKFTCICVDSDITQDEISHQSTLIEHIHSRFYESAPVEFVCGCGHDISPNPSQVYSIFGVPTFAIFHPNGTLGWLGRHASKNFKDFESFFMHTANRVHDVTCEFEQCEYCVSKTGFRSISHSYSFLSEGGSRSIHSSASCRTTSAASTAKLRNSRKDAASVYSVGQKPKMYKPLKK